MPHFQLSIRLRGHRTDKPTTTSTHTFKHLFFGRDHRARTTEATTNDTKNPTSTDKMGNAPSDMNSRTSSPRERRAQLARSATDTESVRSASAMPGAEPSIPAPTTSSPPLEPWRSPSPTEEVRVAGYDVQDVPHVQNPTPAEEKDLGAGPIVAQERFTAEVSNAPEEQAGNDEPAHAPHVEVYTDAQVEPETAKTPRAAVMSEEFLAPVEEEESGHASPPGLEHHTHNVHHEPEASDATAVSTDAGPGTSPGTLWAPGTYVLLNARGGTAVDLSGMDNKALIGYPMHGGENQQWEFIPSGHGYVIRCVRRSKDGHPLYLTTEDGLRENAAIVASPYPVSWNVEQTEEGIRISWPNTDFVFDLAEWGSNTPGTKIQLMRLKPGEPCQLWHYTRCAPAEHDKEVEVRSARAVSPPASTETVSVTEERDYITTTRTTTTTSITTVTEVTRMPRWMLLHARPQSPNRRSIGYRFA